MNESALFIVSSDNEAMVKLINFLDQLSCKPNTSTCMSVESQAKIEKIKKVICE